MKSKFLNSSYVFWKWWKTWKTIPVVPWVRAASRYRAGQFEEAAALYRRGLAKNIAHPAQFCARLDLAYCLFRLGDYQEAESELRYVTSRMRRAREAFLRLAKLQLWTGRSLEAGWTMRRALRDLAPDAELVSIFGIAVLESGGPDFLLNEVKDAWHGLSEKDRAQARVRAMHARMRYLAGDQDSCRAEMEAVAVAQDAPLEAILLYAETLLEEGKIAHARLELRRALALEPNHPRILSLLAKLYMRSGRFYSADYAVQHAIAACQETNWLSAREMHVLAHAYYHAEDYVSSLVMASKAKEQGSKLLGEYRDMPDLDHLIAEISSSEGLSLKPKML
jgi:Flp pilus assembly protein TadD